MRSDLPTGTVTFLSKDVEGSIRLHELDAEAYAEALARHRRLIREACNSSSDIPARSGTTDCYRPREQELPSLRWHATVEDGLA